MTGTAGPIQGDAAAAMTAIDTVAALEGVLGKTPPPMHLKVIDHLDEGARRWIAASPLLFAGFGDAATLAITLGGGASGFAGTEARMLRLPLAALDEPALARPGAGFGALFLAPGLGETLRVNGRVAGIEGGEARIAVEECYVHCAKALIRSAFWAAPRLDAAPEEAAAFAAASRFMALATSDPGGHADLSPKGDPATRLARLEGDALWFPDRPGNRRADSFRNIIAQPRIAAALLLPGTDHVLILGGRARLTTEETAREGFAVEGKVPPLVTRVELASLALRRSAALGRAALWPVAAPVEGIDPVAMFTAHVRLNRDKGLSARLAGAVVSIPGLMRKGLEKDYKSNLY